MNKLNLLIVGHGFVGQAVDYGFSGPNVYKTIVDPKYPDGPKLEELSLGWYDLIFVCVPTPFGSDGRIDSSILDRVMKTLRGGATIHDNTIAIKSTVTPDVLAKFTHHGVVYNPEFLTEKSANEQFINPQFHVFGGMPEDVERLNRYYEKYSLCNPCPVYKMGMKEASMVKYTINSFLAMKVTFFNQMYDLARSNGIDFNAVIKTVGEDSRIGHSHTKVPGFDGKQGFGGACFPKDVAALIKYSDESLTLLQQALIINNSYRAQYERDEREVAQNITYTQKDPV